MLIAVDHGNKQIKTVHTPPFTSGLIQSDTPGFGTDALAYAARRRSRIGTMVWWAGWCGIDPELSENVRAGLKAKDRSRHAQTGKPLYKTLYRQVRCGSLRTLLVSINTS